MPIFRLEDSELIIAQETDLELESHLEDWLENSPLALAQEPILWIGRQTSAAVEDSTIFPDLLGIDSDGNPVIVELKRDKAPRDVVAQLLEYAAWANDLSDIQIQEIAQNYLEIHRDDNGNQFQDVLKETFDIPDSEELPPLNRNLRLYIVAEYIPSRITNVCRFLRTSHGVDVNCIDVSAFQTEAGEKLVSMESKFENGDVIASKNVKKSISQTTQWSSDKTAREVVLDAVQELTKGNKNMDFAVKDVKPIILKKYPDFKMSTLGAQIIAACVNHPSRKHHPSYAKHKHYWRLSIGKYRLYDPEKDKIEDTADAIQN